MYECDKTTLSADTRRFVDKPYVSGSESSKREIEFGSQIRSYTLAPYRMVKDERTEHKSGNVDGVLDGDLDEFIEAYLLMSAGKKPDAKPDEAEGTQA